MRVEELSGIADELKWATPCFRAYVLPQISGIMGKQKSFQSEERKDLESVIAALTAEENAEPSEELAADIIARLRSNIEKSFSVQRLTVLWAPPLEVPLSANIIVFQIGLQRPPIYP